MKVLWNKCSITKLSLAYQNNPKEDKSYTMHIMLHSKYDEFSKGTTVDTNHLQLG